VRYDMKMLEDALADCKRAHGADPSEDSTYLTASLHRMLGRPSAAMPLLEGAISTPIESGGENNCRARLTSLWRESTAS